MEVNLTEKDFLMNKNDLVSHLADGLDVKKELANRFVDSFVETVTDCLKKGDEVRLPGFGNFVATHRKAKMGRNPQTGEPVQIKAANVPKFKAGKALKEALN